MICKYQKQGKSARKNCFQILKVNVAVKGLEKALESKEKSSLEAAKNELLTQAKDVLSDWLDSLHGHSVNDHAVFEKLAKK